MNQVFENAQFSATRLDKRRPLNLVERVTAFLLILVTLPIMFAIAILLCLKNGGRVLYVGERLGYGKRRFRMYKFRSLTEGARGIVGGRLLAEGDGLVLPFGKFLRDTRLDELPQLLNILKGDMRFVGPRPVRPEVYESLCRNIRNYDYRFLVKPGLVGISQLFTPHRSPKRLRAYLDNLHVRRPRDRGSEMALTCLAGLNVLRSAVVRLLHKSLSLLKAKYGAGERRKFDRKRPHLAEAIVKMSELGNHRLDVLDISSDFVCISSRFRIEEPRLTRFHLRIPVRRPDGKRRVKTAVCDGRVQQVRTDGADSWAYVVAYRPSTSRSEYIVDQYFLDKSLVKPFKNSDRRAPPFQAAEAMPTGNRGRVASVGS